MDEPFGLSVIVIGGLINKADFMLPHSIRKLTRTGVFDGVARTAGLYVMSVQIIYNHFFQKNQF